MKKSSKDIEIFHALRELVRLPCARDKVGTGARLFYALGGAAADRRRLQKVLSNPAGARLLKERPQIGKSLCDEKFLASLKVGSVGREYLDWAQRERLSVADLAAAVSPSYPTSADEPANYLRARGRDLHDLLHVVTGYGRDESGEAALLAFTAVQSENAALDRLSILACVSAFVRGRFDVFRIRSDARRRATRAAFLLIEDWSGLLARPLDEVRRDLRLAPTARPATNESVPTRSHTRTPN